MPKSDKVKINVKDRIDDQTIDLSLSDISEVPVGELIKYKRATILDLSSNRIIHLSKNFSTLTHLTRLDLSKNQITSLPDDIGKLINLRHLDLYDNRIEHLPLSFGRLKSLRYLDLNGNPLAPALASIVGSCVTSRECLDAARKIVTFLANYQTKLNEQLKEKRKQEQLNRLNAEAEEKENQRKFEEEEAKLKVKAKKEKRKAKKEAALQSKDSSSELTNGKLNQSTISNGNARLPASTCGRSFLKLFTCLFFIWFLFIIAAVVNVIKFPDYTQVLINQLPNHYQPIFNEYAGYLRNHILKLIGTE